MKIYTCALIGLIFLLSLSMTSCGVGVEKQISFSKIPDPTDYAITHRDLPSYFESDYYRVLPNSLSASQNQSHLLLYNLR